MRSVICDTDAFDGAEYPIAVAAFGGPTWGRTVLLEHGDHPALRDAAEIQASDLTGAEDGGRLAFPKDGGIRQLGYKGKKRYIRASIAQG